MRWLRTFVSGGRALGLLVDRRARRVPLRAVRVAVGGEQAVAWRYCVSKGGLLDWGGRWVYLSSHLFCARWTRRSLHRRICGLGEVIMIALAME